MTNNQLKIQEAKDTLLLELAPYQNAVYYQSVVELLVLDSPDELSEIICLAEAYATQRESRVIIEIVKDYLRAIPNFDMKAHWDKVIEKEMEGAIC